MAKKTLYYRCKNKYEDPCQYAESGRKIPDSEVISSFDGKPKCPGKTRSGNPCNMELVLIGPSPAQQKSGPGTGDGWQKWALIGGSVALLILLAGTLLCYIMRGEPKLAVTPATLVFSLAKGGAATADIRISNDGDGSLDIDGIEVRPSAFSVSEGKISIAPNKDAKLSVRFQSPSTEMTEGELVLHSNDKNAREHTVKLIANRDPWWVYRKLESTSKILNKGP